MDVLNVENAGAIFYFAQISHNPRAQQIYLGLIEWVWWAEFSGSSIFQLEKKLLL